MRIEAGHRKACLGLWLSVAGSLACHSESGEYFAVWSAEPGGYRIESRCLSSLDDPVAMSGELGRIRSGGWLEQDEAGEIVHHLGSDLELSYHGHEGTLWPLDTEGLILLSFWAHLEDTRARIQDVGLQAAELPAVEVAYGPRIPDWSMELFPFENAAYMPGAHLLFVLPEFEREGIPLAANRGVVAHEWGHAVFHELIHGDPWTVPSENPGTERALYLSALHEGFADAMSALLFEDPRFLDASLDIPARRLDQRLLLSDVQTPEEYQASEEFQLFYDPYPLGSVIASWYWALSQGSSSRDEVLLLLEAGGRALAEDLDDKGGWNEGLRWRMLEGSLDAAEPSLRTLGCSLAADRLSDVTLAPCTF